MTYKFLGFSSGVVEVFVRLGCGVASLGNRFPMLSNHYIVLEHRTVKRSHISEEQSSKYLTLHRDYTYEFFIYNVFILIIKCTLMYFLH